MYLSRLLISLFLTGSIFSAGLAQPGYIEIEKPVDDFSEKEIQECINSPNFFKCTFIIDSESDRNNLKQISGLREAKWRINSKKLPVSISGIEFRELTSLHIVTDKLETLENLPHIPNLNTLRINGYQGKELPKKLSQFNSLKKVSVSSDSLVSAAVFGKLTGLTDLSLRTPALERLPKFRRNHQLSQFLFSGKSELFAFADLSELKGLRSITISGGELRSIPERLNANIERIYFAGLPKLVDVSSLTTYKQLKSIRLYQTGIETLDLDLSSLKHLTDFDFSGNSKLTSIKSINTLQLAEEVKIYDLPKLERIEFKGLKPSTKKIEIRNLPSLKEVVGIGGFESLQEIVFQRAGIETVPQSLSFLPKLEQLYFGHCHQLKDISALQNFPVLKGIHFYECDNLSSIPSTFATNTELEKIRLEFLDGLLEAPGLAGLKSVNSIVVRAVGDEFQLPENLSQSQSLRTIVIGGERLSVDMIKDLPNLKKLAITHGLSNLPETIYSNQNLEWLEVYLSDLEDLSMLTNFKHLNVLKLKHNEHLITIPSEEELDYIGQLDIQYNKRFHWNLPYGYRDGWRVRNNGEGNTSE